MRFFKKLLFVTVFSILSVAFVQLATINKAYAETVASSSNITNIKSFYIKMYDYPINGSNWPKRNQNGCNGSADKLKVFPWIGQYDDNYNGQPGTGDYFDEAGNCSSKFLDGGTDTTGLIPLKGAWIYPTAYGGWVNGGGVGWATPVDTNGCPTDSDVIGQTTFVATHIWGQCDIDMTNQSDVFYKKDEFKGIKYNQGNGDGRNLYSNGSTLFVEEFMISQAQFDAIGNGGLKLDFNAQSDDWFAIYINRVFLGGSTVTAIETQLPNLTTSQLRVGKNYLAIQVIDKAVWTTETDKNSGAHFSRDAGIAYQLNLTPGTGNSYDLYPDYGIDIASRTVNFSINNRGDGESYSNPEGGAPNGVTVKRFVKIKGIDYVISPDVIEQKIPGGETWYYPFLIPASVTLTPGDEVCAYISVTPAVGITGGAVSTLESHKGSKTSPTCATVSSKPYFRAYGNDVIVGRRFADGTTCNARLGSQYIRAYTTGSGAGAGVQFASSATGVIEKFMSASMHSGSTGGNEIPKPDSGLTFANTPALGNDAGAYAGCMGDYKALAEDLSGGNWESDTTIDNKDDLNNNRLFVNGSLTINGNIGSSGTDYYKLSDVKINLIIVKGNIYIDPSVTNIDAILIALPDSGNNNGIINTCGTSNTPDLVTCKSKSLTVNGAIMARKIKFNRLIGDVSVTTSNEASTSDNIAEKIIFTPDFFLGLLNTKITPPQVGSYEYDSISSLPPTF